MEQYSLVDLRAFVAVVEAGSFRQAADRLDTSVPSVSRRVGRLEAAHGVKLLQRTTRKLSLTEAGERYYEDVKQILLSLNASEERLNDRGDTPSGHLRIVTSYSFGAICLAPLLPEFLARYPAISVELSLDDGTTDLLSAGMDLALRIGRLGDSSTLVAKKICDIDGLFCASPVYLSAHGEPQSPAELVQHNCLHYTPTSRKREWNLSDNATVPQGQFSCNNGQVLATVAAAGGGILSTPRFAVVEAIRQGTLKPILQKHKFVSLGLYSVRPSRNYMPVKVLAMIDFLRDNQAQFASVT